MAILKRYKLKFRSTVENGLKQLFWVILIFMHSNVISNCGELMKSLLKTKDEQGTFRKPVKLNSNSLFYVLISKNSIIFFHFINNFDSGIFFWNLNLGFVELGSALGSGLGLRLGLGLGFRFRVRSRVRFRVRIKVWLRIRCLS